MNPAAMKIVFWWVVLMLVAYGAYRIGVAVACWLGGGPRDPWRGEC